MFSKSKMTCGHKIEILIPFLGDLGPFEICALLMVVSALPYRDSFVPAFEEELSESVIGIVSRPAVVPCLCHHY